MSSREERAREYLKKYGGGGPGAATREQRATEYRRKFGLEAEQPEAQADTPPEPSRPPELLPAPAPIAPPRPMAADAAPGRSMFTPAKRDPAVPISTHEYPSVPTGIQPPAPMAADATRAVPAAQQKNNDVSFIKSFLEGQKGNVRSLAEWLDLRAARIREPRGARLRGLVTPQELHPSSDDVVPEKLEQVADWLREHGQASHEYLARVPRARDIESLQDFVDWATHAAGQGIASSMPTLAAATIAAPLGVPAMAAAGAIPSIIQNTGALAEQLKAEGQDPVVADVMGLPIAALDVITPTRLASKLVGGTTGKLATRVLKGAAESILTEGATEGAQTFLEEATTSRAKREPVLTKENLIRSLEGAAAGTVPGAILGGASGVKQQEATQAPPAPQPDPLPANFAEWLAGRSTQDEQARAARRPDLPGPPPDIPAPPAPEYDQPIGPAPVPRRRAGRGTPPSPGPVTPPVDAQPAPTQAAPAPSDVAEVDPRTLKVDPGRFQYKLDVDDTGVGRELKSVKKYDANLAGVVQVWTDPADGLTYVVNGHHRHDLAMRTGQQKELVRYIEAKDAAEARTIGARTNIAEGRGTPIDAAKLFRDQGIDAPALEQMGISRTGAVARDALAISKLPQALFQDVVSGRLPIARGAVIGGAGLNEAQQLSLVQMLRGKEKTGRRLTNEQVGELIRFVRGAGETQTTQDSLFGEETLTQSLAIEKAELSSYIKQRLAQDKAAFSAVLKAGRASRLEQAGVGKIDVERADALKTEAEELGEVYNRLSTMSGPVATALNKAAARLAKGEDGNAIRADLYDAARAGISSELQALTGGRGTSAPASQEAPARPAAPREAGRRGTSRVALPDTPSAPSRNKPQRTYEELQGLIDQREDVLQARGIDVITTPLGEMFRADPELEQLYSERDAVSASLDDQSFEVVRAKLPKVGPVPIEHVEAAARKLFDNELLFQRSSGQASEISTEVMHSIAQGLYTNFIHQLSPGGHGWPGSLEHAAEVSEEGGWGRDTTPVVKQVFDTIRAFGVEPRAGLIEAPAANRRPSRSTVGFPEIQDDIFGGPPKVTGDPQSELFAPETRGSLARTERRARRTIERLRPLISAGKATEEQRQEYRDALALARRDKKQSTEEVQLRAEGERQPRDTRDMFGEVAGSPDEPATSNPAFQESLPAAARSTPPPDPLVPATANLPNQISRALSGSLETPANPLDPTSAPEVIDALGKVLEAVGRSAPMRVGLQRVRNARGYFRIKEEVIRLQQANDIPTAAHELAHALEKALYGWPKQGPWKSPLVTGPMARELAALGRKLYGNVQPVGGYKREGFAEFVRIWVTESDHSGNPDHVDSAAPQFTKWFESEFLGKLPEVRAALEEARDKALRWRTQGAATRAKQSVIDPAAPSERLQASVDAVKNVDVYRLFVESAASLERLSQAAAEKLGRSLDVANDPFFTTAALRLTHTARARYMVEEHMIDLAGNPVGDPLKDIRALVQGRKDDFTIYLWARRSLVLWNSGRNPGLSVQDAQQIIKELGSPAFQLAASKVYEWNAGVLNYAAQASPTFQLVVDRIRADEKKNGPRDYIPLMREFEQLDKVWGGASRVATKNSPVKRLKGSGRRIKDPFQSMITLAEQTILAAHKRLILDQIFRLNKIEGMGSFLEEIPAAQKKVAEESVSDLMKKLAHAGVPFDVEAMEAMPKQEVAELLEQTISFFGPSEPSDGENPVVPFYDQGKLRYFVVPRELYRSLAGLDLYRLPRAVDLVLGVPARLARAGTTGLRASFGLVTNPLRDVQTLYVNTRAKGNGLQLLQAWLQGLKDAALYRTAGRKSEWVDAFVRLGGEMAQPLGQDIPHTRRAARRLFAGRKQQLLDPRNWYDGFRDLVQFPESAPRTAELKLVAQEIGWKPGENMSFSQSLRLLTALKQVTTDFTAAGEISRVVNQIVPFHNAAIQGPRASLRALKRNPGQFAWRGAQLTALTLMLWWLHKDDEWWKEMDARERATYWHFPVGDDLLVRIPRSFEIGQFFSALPESLADAAYQADPDAMTEWFTTTFQVSKPPVLPVPVSEAIEQAANKDFYFGRPIVTKANEFKPAEEQFNEYTSRAAIALGGIFNQSPQRIDHAISSAFGPVGGDVLSVLGLGAKEIPREKEAADLPIVGRLFQRGGQIGTRPRSVEKLYQALDKAEKRQHSDRRTENEVQRQQRLQLSDAAQAVSALLYVRQYTPENEKRRALTREMLRLASDAVKRNERGSVVRDRFAGARETAQDRKAAVKTRVESARVARRRVPGGKEPAAAQPR